MLSVSTLTILVQAASVHGQPPDPVIPWGRILFAFLFCIALAVGAILWLRARHGVFTDLRGVARRVTRRHPAPVHDELEVQNRLRVSPSSQVMVLRCGERRYLVHMGGQGAQLIDRLDDISSMQEAGE